MISYLIPLIGFWFAKITGIPQSFTILKRKPFVCSKCLSFWFALIHEICVGFSVDSWWYIPICSLAGYLLEVIATKLKLPMNV